MKQTRCTGANTKKKFNSFSDFLRTMAGQLYGCCDCDGRGCTVCISADAMEEAAGSIDQARILIDGLSKQ